MKAIVVYYSLTGKTKAIAEGFAKELEYDLLELKEIRKRSVIGAYFLGAFAAMRGKGSEIESVNIGSKAYDTIIVATPVWASAQVPAVNTFLANTDFKNKKAILLICPASGDDSKAYRLMADKIHSKGGIVLQHHAVKTGGASASELGNRAVELAKLYK